MKILFLGHNLSYTGAPKSLLRIMRYMHGHELVEFECLVRNSGPLVEEYKQITEVHEFLPQVFIPRKGEVILNLIRRIQLRIHRAGLKKNLKDGKFDLIYCNTVVNANVVAWLTTFLDVPVVAHLREMHTAIDAYGGRPMIQSLDSAVATYIAVSNRASTVLAEYGVSPEKIQIVHNFLEDSEMTTRVSGNADSVRSQLRLKEGDHLVGNVGTFNGRKGNDIFVYTAKQVLRTKLNTHFVWVGGYSDEEVNNLLSDFPPECRERMHFVGEVPHPYEYYEVMDVLLLSSRDDPFPLTAMEGAYFKKPVVCIRGTGGIPEVLDGHPIVSNTDSFDELSSIILRLLNDDPLREQMGQACHQLLIEDLHIDKQMRKILEILEETRA
jgi:glycosyltransferase involved in cell wall biosynthesis